jgi:hypothetical protein
MEAVEFPDTTTLVVDYLADLVDVDVFSEVPNPRPDSFVVVRRLGGPRRNLVADGAQIGVECFGSDDVDAYELAAAARAHLIAMYGQVVDGVQVYRVDELAGPSSSPDPDSGQARYTFQESVMVRGVRLTPGS